MTYKASAFFYTVIYIVAVSLSVFLNNELKLGIASFILFGLPVLYILSLGLNYYLFRACLGRAVTFINALMLSSMGRLVGFSAVLVTAIFLNKSIVLPVAILVSALYLISTGADAYFAKRFR